MSTRRKALVDLVGTIHHETDKAYLFQPDDDPEAIWLPKSQCQWDEGANKMTLPEWLAIDKGLV